MGGSCPVGQYRDAVVKTCVHCQVACQEPRVVARCISYCASDACKKLPGHYYDRLLKKCMKCAEVCGRHPSQCSQHCLTTSLPVTSKALPVTSHPLSSVELSPPVVLEDSTTVLYSLLALCLVLLFSSLSLTLTVFLRRTRGHTSTPAAKAMKHKHERGLLPGEEVGMARSQLLQTSKDFLTTLSLPTEQEALDESSPTETCVCVHCFPDLKGNDRSRKATSNVNQAAALPQAFQKSRPLWNDGSLQTSGFKEVMDMTSICCLSNQSVSQENGSA